MRKHRRGRLIKRIHDEGGFISHESSVDGGCEIVTEAPGVEALDAKTYTMDEFCDALRKVAHLYFVDPLSVEIIFMELICPALSERKLAACLDQPKSTIHLKLRQMRKAGGWLEAWQTYRRTHAKGKK